MVNRLADAGIVSEQNVQRANSVLSDYWTGKIALVWQADDVRAVIAQKLDVEVKDVYLSDLVADEILQSVLDHQDCSIGVNWDTIQWETEEALGESIHLYTIKTDFIKLKINNSPMFYILPNIPKVIKMAEEYFVDKKGFDKTDFVLEPAANAGWKDVDKDILVKLKNFDLTADNK
jgi:hypothetical protein